MDWYNPTEIQQTISDIQSVLDQVRQQLNDDPGKLLSNLSPEIIEQLDRDRPRRKPPGDRSFENSDGWLDLFWWVAHIWSDPPIKVTTLWAISS